MQQVKFLTLGLLSLTSVCLAGPEDVVTSAPGEAPAAAVSAAPCRNWRQKLVRFVGRGTLYTSPIWGGGIGWYARDTWPLWRQYFHPSGEDSEAGEKRELTDGDRKSDKKMRSDAFAAFMKGLDASEAKTLSFRLIDRDKGGTAAPEITVWNKTGKQIDLARMAKSGIAEASKLEAKKHHNPDLIVAFDDRDGLPIKLTKINFTPKYDTKASTLFTSVNVTIETNLGYVAKSTEPISVHSLFEGFDESDPEKIAFVIREGNFFFTFYVNTSGNIAINWQEKRIVLQKASAHVEVLKNPDSIQELNLPTMTTVEKLP